MQCPICKKELKALTAQHLWKHNITVNEFKIQYPDIMLGNRSGAGKRERSAILDDIHCLQCQKLLTKYNRRRVKFCSQSCAATYNNLLKGKTSKPEIICKNCSRPFKAYKGQFCSSICSSEFKSNTVKQSIFQKIDKNEELSGSICSKQAWLKKYIIEKKGNKCSNCGWDTVNTFTNKIPIELDHIDGDCDNNELINLRLLCPNCHSLTPHFKGGNKTYRKIGRKSKRYLKWKQYFK